MRARFLVPGILAVAAAFGCSKKTPSTETQPVVATPLPSPSIGLARWSHTREGATMMVVKAAGMSTDKVVVIADEDGRAIRFIDPIAKKELGSAPVTGRPGQMLVLNDGRLAVALRDDAAVTIYQLHADYTLEPQTRLPSESEPVGLALSPDESTLWVACGFAHTAMAFDLTTKEKKVAIDVPREPRGLMVSDDGKSVLLTHATAGELTMIDGNARRGTDLGAREISFRQNGIRPFMPHRMPLMLDFGIAESDVAPFLTSDNRAPPPPPQRKAIRQIDFEDIPDVEMDFGSQSPQRFARQAFAAVRFQTKDGPRVLMPHTEVLTGDPHVISTGYGGGGLEEDLPTEVFTFSIIDPSTGKRTATRSAGTQHCSLPRDIAIDTPSDSAIVACLGTSNVVVSTHLMGDAKHRSAPVSTPSALAIDRETRVAYVYSQLDATLSAIQLDALEANKDDTRIDVAPVIRLSRPSGLDELALAGRKLFHQGNDPRISKDGRACASCHPDGRDDGLVWSTPNGPRQTITLMERIKHTQPFGWQGAHATLQNHMTQTMKNLQGTGLTDHEHDALAAYLVSLKGPAQKWRSLTTEEQRGKDIFESTDAACATCHTPGTSFTDHETHDVKSATLTDKQHAFLVPALTGIAGTAPYFHDGRYATLEELIEKSDGTMGQTKQLSAQDKKALVSYLKTL